MQTRLLQSIKNTSWGETADNILRSCVHCGFCTATCPTYQLLGDELDSPRGRIYQIKQFLETGDATRKTQLHLDRCLTCRSCETTCPSGVEYAHLLDIGREQIEKNVKRPVVERVFRYLLRKIFTNDKLFKLLIHTGHTFSFLLPAALKQQLPAKNIQTEANRIKSTSHNRKMLLLNGCVQNTLSPEINAATIRLLNRLDIELISTDGCCGAIDHHLSATVDARQRIKANIDHWWRYLDEGVEVIISTASGCGVMVKDYKHLLQDDPEYYKKARIISESTRDISQVILELLEQLKLKKIHPPRLSIHSPCTLQHGQKLNGYVEEILSKLGFRTYDIVDSHLCCGSAGTYSILQNKLSSKLRDNKLEALQLPGPDIIVSSNIGCLLHLRSTAEVPVMHWINLVEQCADIQTSK